MHDVIVVDEEHQASASNFSAACSEIDRLMDQYLTLMHKAAATGLVSGSASDALDVYITYAETLKGAASIIAGRNVETKDAFLRSIDSADTYLF